MDEPDDAVNTAGGGDSRLKARDDVVCRQVDEEWVLYDPATEKMHVLNVTAGLVWQHLDGTNSVEDLVILIRDTFEPVAEADVVSRDVRGVLDQFESEGLLD